MKFYFKIEIRECDEYFMTNWKYDLYIMKNLHKFVSFVSIWVFLFWLKLKLKIIIFSKITRSLQIDFYEFKYLNFVRINSWLLLKNIHEDLIELNIRIVINLSLFPDSTLNFKIFYFDSLLKLHIIILYNNSFLNK